jgi:hypothetical protein
MLRANQVEVCMNITVAEYKLTGSEHNLQVQVLDLISVKKSDPNIFAFAIPNAAQRSPRLAAKMRAEGLTAGVADLAIMLPCSRVAWLELKKAKNQQSPKQRAFEARCKRLGHPYAVASCIERAEAFLKQIGAIK